MRKLSARYFRKPAIELAPDLIGKILVRKINGKEFRARIVETEAYVGPADLASHSSKGRTPRTEVMFGPPGRAYVYFIYGVHWMFNIVAGEVGQAVLIRAAEPLDGWNANLTGPGNFTKALRIARAENGLDLTGDSLFLAASSPRQARVHKTVRIGVDYAKEWKHQLLRFIDPGSPALSGSRRLNSLTTSSKRNPS